MADAPNNVHQHDPAALVARITELEEKLDALPMRLLEAAQATKPLMSVKDVARTLSVGVRTVETLIADGELRPLWIKGQRRFHPDTVAAFVNTCAMRSAA